MPFFDPFKFFTRNKAPFIKTYIYSYIKIIGKLVGRMMVQFFVFIFIIVAQRRNITQYCRCCWKASGTFSIKKLFIGK